MAVGRFVGVAASVMMFAMAPAAHATVFNTYHPGDGVNFYLTSGTPFSQSITANFGDGFSSAVSFDDKFEFIIPLNGLGSGSISTSFSSSRNKLTISSLIINGTTYAVPSNGSGQFLAVNDIPILLGVTNVIEVIGKTASRGGTFSGTLTFAAADVPEPASWAMMLGGFGLIGGAMRARRKAAVSFA